jgi:N-acetylglucosaminyldiphosphoundecaprenol N-acetyl-beta-D-mannosaminyltransferase
MKETLSKVEEAIDTQSQLHHVAVNAGKIVEMQKDLQLRKSVNNSDIINADGQAVVWAAKFLNKPLKERVAGIDLMEKLVELSFQKNYKLYFLGAEEKIVSKLVEHYRTEYNSYIIAGHRNGYFKAEEEDQVVQDIASSGANILFVAMTSPKKENFLYKYKSELKAVNFIMGVGGSFDVVAGKTKRAPVWMQNTGMEWFYRFLQEPKRMWKRYLVGNTKFILLVLKEKISLKKCEFVSHLFTHLLSFYSILLFLLMSI